MLKFSGNTPAVGNFEVHQGDVGDFGIFINLEPLDAQVTEFRETWPEAMQVLIDHKLITGVDAA